MQKNIVYGLDNNKNPVPITVNDTGFPVIITSVHDRIHSGVFYRADDSATLALIGDKRHVYIQTTGITHFRLSVFGIARGKSVLYEAPTVSASGTGILSYNRNRNLSNTATTLLSHTPTITASGVAIATNHFGFDHKTGGSFTDNEWILASGVNYLIEVETEVNTNYTDISLDWYES